MLDASLPPGLPPNKLDGSRNLLKLKTVSQRLSVEVRAGPTQRDREKNAQDLDTSDPRKTVHAEMMSNGIRGTYVTLIVGRFRKFPINFITLRDYIARKKAYAHVEHYNSNHRGEVDVQVKYHVVARGWARLILDRRRDLINGRPNRAAAAEAPLGRAAPELARCVHKLAPPPGG